MGIVGGLDTEISTVECFYSLSQRLGWTTEKGPIFNTGPYGDPPYPLKIKILKSGLLHGRQDQKIGPGPNCHEPRSSNGWYYRGQPRYILLYERNINVRNRNDPRQYNLHVNIDVLGRLRMSHFAVVRGNLWHLKSYGLEILVHTLYLNPF